MSDLLIYETEDKRIEVRLAQESIWLNRQQMATLFGRDVKTIGKHVNNVFKEGELAREGTVANFATVQIEGRREVTRQVEYYNLDVIISVGYRVKSLRGLSVRRFSSPQRPVAGHRWTTCYQRHRPGGVDLAGGRIRSTTERDTDSPDHESAR